LRIGIPALSARRMQSQVPRECSRERLSRPQHHCRPSPGCVSGRRPGRGRASRQDAAREARQHDRPTPVPDRFEILLFVTALRNVVRGAEALLGYEHEAVKSFFYMAVPNAKAVRRAGALRRVMRGIGNLQKKRVMEDPPAGQWRVYYSSNEPVGGERRIHVDGLELDVRPAARAAWALAPAALQAASIAPVSDSAPGGTRNERRRCD
jgi:hypothetical protein